MLVETISLEIDKCKSKNAALVSEVLAISVGALKGIFDLPYCQNKHYLCLKYRPISGCSVKRINNISMLIIRKRHHKVPLITKQE